MKRYIFGFSFIFCAFLHAQENPIQVKLLSVTRTDSVETERCFTIKYQIINNTNHDISFVLNTKSLNSTVRNSLGLSPSYQIYQNEKPVEAGSNLIALKRRINIDLSNNKSFDSIVNLANNDSKKIFEMLKQNTSKKYLDNLKHLKPNDFLEVTCNLYWNKNRYYLENNDLEYFLSETDKHTIKINVVVYKDRLEKVLTESDFKKLLENEDLITGWYTSNALPIDFGK